MTTLGDLRADLVSRLSDAGITALSYVPENPTTPLCVVRAGSPYIAQPEIRAFSDSEYQIRFEILIFAAALDNQTATDALDELIETALIALSGYKVEEVFQPGQMASSPILGTRITISYIETIK